VKRFAKGVGSRNFSVRYRGGEKKLELRGKGKKEKLYRPYGLQGRGWKVRELLDFDR